MAIGRGCFELGNDASLKYKDEYADMLLDYFKVDIARIEYKREYTSTGDIKSEMPMEFVNDFPTMGMFARSIGVSLSTVKAWAGIGFEGRFRHERFAYAFACCKEWAEDMIESGALSGKLDANMAKFVLTNNYGRQDKQVIEASVSSVSDKDMELIRRVSERLGKGE